MKVKPLSDANGILAKAYKILPLEYYSDFIHALAELEDNDCHANHKFPHTQLHKVSGIKDVAVYRAYIHKTSGWRLHVQYCSDNILCLSDILEGQEHDDAVKKIKTRKNKYKKK